MKQFKVKFTARGGWQHQQDYAKTVLEIGEEYIVKIVNVSGWYTFLTLKGFGTCEFNSALFEDSENINELVQKGLGLYYLEEV